MLGFWVICYKKFEFFWLVKDDKGDRVDGSSLLKIGVKLLLGLWVFWCGCVMVWKVVLKYVWNLKWEM